MAVNIVNLARAVEAAREMNLYPSETEVVLLDLSTGQEIEIDEIGMDGDNRIVIKFDYEGRD